MERMIDLTEQLRRYMRKSGYTMNALAREAGVGYPIVYDFMHERRVISIASAAKICRVLGLTLQPRPEPKQRQRSKGR